MSQQDTYGPPGPPPPPGAPLQAPPPPPGYGYQEYGGYPQQPQGTNTMAILGLIFAFVFAPLGIVFSALGLKQTKERREGGRGLALAGMILSIVFVAIWVIVMVFVFAVAGTAVKVASDADAAISSASAALDSAASAASEAAGSAADQTGDQSGDQAGVAAACHTVLPALTDVESSLADVTNVDEYRAALAQLQQTIEGAAAATADPQFHSHVQALSDDFQAVSDAVAAGKDPSSFAGTLVADAAAVVADCSAVGVTD